jgi:hypothetical protein
MSLAVFYCVIHCCQLEHQWYLNEFMFALIMNRATVSPARIYIGL